MPASHRCPYCQSSQPTRAAVNRHISQRPACQQKWRESLGISVTVAREESEQPEEPPSDTPLHAASPEFFSREVPDEDDEDDEGVEEFIPPPRHHSPEPAAADPIPRSRRATVEEVLDDDDPQNFSRFVEAFPGEETFPGHATFVGASAESLGQGQTVFERMRAEQTADGLNPHAPFLDADEWNLASWLSKNVTQTATDSYILVRLKTERVSFHNNYAYLKKVDQLPTGPGWKCEIVTAAGNKLDEDGEMMKEDLELWKRDRSGACLRQHDWVRVEPDIR